MTEKEILTKEEMIEDKDVDSVSIHLCDHSPEGVGTENGCRVVDLEEGQKFFDDRDKDLKIAELEEQLAKK